jgi:hypothetical protein
VNRGVKRESEQKVMNEKRQSAIFTDGLLEKMRDMHRAWFENLQMIRQVESEFGARIVSAKSSAEAINICNDWMKRRLELISAEQSLFVAGWLSLISDMVAHKEEAQAKSNGAVHQPGPL